MNLPGTTHSSLQSIGTRARQHLVDADNVVGVGANTKMETFFSSDFDEVSVGGNLARKLSPKSALECDVLVGTDTSGFECFGRQLFEFVGDHVNAEGEFVYVGTFAA